MQADRALEVRGEAGVIGEHPPAAQRPGNGPWLPLRVGCGHELGRGALRVVVAPELQVAVDELGGG